MRKVWAIAVSGLFLCESAGMDRAIAGGSIESWAQMRAAFVGCWTVPAGTEGSVMAFRFLLAPDGGLRGPPRLMARILKGDEPARKTYEASAYAALDRCLPLALSPTFKAVLGETLIQLRFVNTPREPALNLGSAITIFAEETRRP